MSLKESGEMYLETIYILCKSKSSVRSIDVAEYMNFSRASVSRGIGLLKKQDLILMDKDGYITLTEKGLKTAEKIYERHTVISKMLMAMGIDEKTATEDACRIEHVISDKTFEAMKQHTEKYTI
ncbi:MAG: metal-dependent transcriptional regulator [Acutalibacteraceae bacterium]|jgi:Mn-dependent DtxR family transcriptional regulator|nr:metal-dependent transcriptional regulator [Acutalibacteraceae bacterium]